MVGHAAFGSDRRGRFAFHAAQHFDIDPGDDVIYGVSVWRDFAGPGEHRVRFVRHLRPAMTVERFTPWEAFRAALQPRSKSCLTPSSRPAHENLTTGSQTWYGSLQEDQREGPWP